MLPKFSQIVNQLYAFIYEMNHSKSGLGLPSIVALGEQNNFPLFHGYMCLCVDYFECVITKS